MTPEENIDLFSIDTGVLQGDPLALILPRLCTTQRTPGKHAQRSSRTSPPGRGNITICQAHFVRSSVHAPKSINRRTYASSRRVID